MEKEPLVSIIIDNYNYAQFIAEAINSALNQTYPHLEVIVVDDGSTDRSREIIAGYGDKITAVFKPNGGQASAFNAGFSKSSGDVIVFLDSDDILLPDAVKKSVLFFASAEHVSKVQWQLLIIDRDGNKTGQTRPADLPPEGDLKDIVLEVGPTSCVSAPTSGNAWSRRFLEEIYPIPEHVAYYRTCADEYMYTLAPVFGSVVTIREPQGYYRIHGNNIYSALPFERKLELELEGHRQQTRALGTVLRQYGYSINEEQWRRNSWFHLMKAGIDDIHAYIPAADAFILIDNGGWEAKDAFPGRTVYPLPELDGAPNGLPEDDAAAMNELNRLIKAGAKYLVFARHCFWWVQHYPVFYRHLEANFGQIVSNDRLVIFDLKTHAIK